MEPSTHCTGPFCPNGNCSGCKDDKLWCDDPRCYPNCRECIPPEDQDLWGWFVVVLIILALVLLIITIWRTMVESQRN